MTRDRGFLGKPGARIMPRKIGRAAAQQLSGQFLFRRPALCALRRSLSLSLSTTCAIGNRRFVDRACGRKAPQCSGCLCITPESREGGEEDAFKDEIV